MPFAPQLDFGDETCISVGFASVSGGRLGNPNPNHPLNQDPPSHDSPSYATQKAYWEENWGAWTGAPWGAWGVATWGAWC
jgi:hypothetical protein